MEDIGGRYFDALVKKSFFDKFVDYYKMHDLLHELAQSASKHECLRVKDDQQLFSKTPEIIRHLFLTTRSQEELKKIGKFKNLRSLFLVYEDNKNVHVDVITKIFSTTRSIRLLYIDAQDLEIISEAFGYLKHIRYLKVANCRFFKWPKSLCNLYHLQFMIWPERSIFRSERIFLKGISDLSNLHYFKFSSFWFPDIPEIGKLTSLQELNDFKIKNTAGYRIGDLEQMNNLRKLRISSLENVEDAQEACNVKLLDKRNLTNLALKWGYRSNPIDLDDENVLDNLQPPSCLQELMIDQYLGIRSAIWMNTADFISNLEIIKLTNCSNWETLPPFGQLHFLKSLHLRSMPKVERFDIKFHGNDEHCLFPSLEMLHICDLKALQDWFDVEEAEDHNMFPCLTELYLFGCPKLQELPYLPPKLNKLRINYIGWKTLNCCTISKLEELDVSGCLNMTNIYLARIATLRLLKIRDCPSLNSVGGHPEVETTEKRQLIVSCLEIDDPSILLMEPLRSITSLHKLIIDEDNDELVLFPIETERWFLKVGSSLRQLKFARLQSLQSLHSSLESLSSLENLSVYAVPELRELPNLPPSLAKLDLRNLDNLDCLPSCLPTLSSLQQLSIRDVPQLRELPNLPLSLANLYLTDLNNLDCLPSCLPSLSSLKELSIIHVPQLQDLPDLPSSLAELYLLNLDNLDCLPSCLPSLSSLKKLSIIDVPRLQDLPDLPSSLAYLSISECHPKLMERYQRDEGSDWHKIAHIPTVYTYKLL